MNDDASDAGPSTRVRFGESTSFEYSDPGSGSEAEYASEQDGPFSDYSEAAEDDEEGGIDEDSKGKGKGFARENRYASSPPSTAKKEKVRSWTDLNMSMVVALIAPIGNWLTGGDHVKHICLLLLLIFYLQQLIEVPWRLYHTSRTHPSITERLKRGVKRADDATMHAAKLALSELRSQELFYLALSIIVPFLGAHLIHHIFAVMEVKSLSWFSTTLFVLATGVRPWSHLAQRLLERTNDLQDAADLPLSEDRHRSLDEKLNSVIRRLESIENAIRHLKRETAKIEPLQEVCDDINEALGDLERGVHRHERKTELARVSHNNRLAVMETSVQRLEERNKHDVLAAAARASRPKDTHAVRIPPPAFQFYLFLRQLLQKARATLLQYMPSSLTKSRTRASLPMSPIITLSPDTSPHQYFNGTPLETIPEDANSDSEGTYVSDKETPLRVSQSTCTDSPKRKASKKLDRSRSSRAPSRTLHTKLFDAVAALASWPYRMTVNLLVFFTPLPIRNLFTS